MLPQVHIVNGAGGDTEGIDPSWVSTKKAPFRAANSKGFRTGYGRATLNYTHFSWQFVYSGADAFPGFNHSTDSGAGQASWRCSCSRRADVGHLFNDLCYLLPCYATTLSREQHVYAALHCT
jgi:hypothetical protein